MCVCQSPNVCWKSCICINSKVVGGCKVCMPFIVCVGSKLNRNIKTFFFLFFMRWKQWHFTQTVDFCQISFTTVTHCRQATIYLTSVTHQKMLYILLHEWAMDSSRIRQLWHAQHNLNTACLLDCPAELFPELNWKVASLIRTSSCQIRVQNQGEINLFFFLHGFTLNLRNWNRNERVVFIFLLTITDVAEIDIYIDISTSLWTYNVKHV